MLVKKQNIFSRILNGNFNEMVMKIVSTAKQLGLLIQKVRKAHGLTQKALAGACGTGVRFIQELEKGKPTAELGKSLYVAKMLGITLEAKLPPIRPADE